jgi:hypothetical protein
LLQLKGQRQFLELHVDNELEAAEALTMMASIIAYSLSRSSTKALKKTLPNAAFDPAQKTPVDILPIAKALRQIAPQHT